MSETNSVVSEISSDEVSSDDANVRDDKDTKLIKFDDDDGDDDCVVLDCDPEKVVNENERVGDGDDVFVVGQKGQIACRDYPHSRHDCAKFPFISTPHETHCDLCHCYVCDSRAPCASWSKGRSSDDHCHANDKNERWKTQREKLRLQKNGTIPEYTTLLFCGGFSNLSNDPDRTWAS